MTAVAKLDAMKRIAAFVAVREKMAGTDPEVITESNGVPLLMSDLRAALSPAELGGVALTTSFVQEVPDKCDRIVWRGHYYHLPVNSEPTPRADEAVTEEVQDAADSILSQLGGWAKAYPVDIFSEPTDEEREWLHATKPGLMDRIAASMGRHMAKCIADDLAALTAALTPPSAKGE